MAFAAIEQDTSPVGVAYTFSRAFNWMNRRLVQDESLKNILIIFPELMKYKIKINNAGFFSRYTHVLM